MALIRPRHLLLLLAILLACALAIIVATRYRPAAELREVAKALPAGVDAALQDIDYTHSEGGITRWRLMARQVEHRTSAQGTAVGDLRLTFYAVDGTEQGAIKASNGKIDADFAVIEVNGDVEIVSRRGFTLKTDHLTFRQQDRSLRSDAPVKLVAAGLQLDGKGLVLDLDRQHLRILAKVRASLDTQH